MEHFYLFITSSSSTVFFLFNSYYGHITIIYLNENPYFPQHPRINEKKKPIRKPIVYTLISDCVNLFDCQE